MVNQWEPGTQYDLGDVVTFENRKYKIIQPHRSQSDWTPPVTPALWGLVQSEESFNPSTEHHEEKQWHEHEHQKVDIPHEEQKKNWFDLDDKRKKELEMGGGLFLGLAAVGAGFVAYKKHEQNEDTKKAQVWGLQQWLRQAQQNTESFHRNGPQGPTTWVLVQGKDIPQGAIPAGQDEGDEMYVARAYYEGSVQVGKASSRLKTGAVIGYGHKEIDLNTYETLLGDKDALRWVEQEGRLNIDELGATPVEGGHESDGRPLFIAKAWVDDAIIPGKCGSHLNGAFVPQGGKEKEVRRYEVLCYA